MAAKAELTVAAIVVNIQGSTKVSAPALQTLWEPEMGANVFSCPRT
jgi:hypothetical protein